MKSKISYLVILLQISLSVTKSSIESSTEKILSRQKRYLIFPEGSSFSVATCMTVGLIGNPEFSFISWGLNYGFAYKLPTNASFFARPGSHKIEEREVETRPMIQRRFRRDLYARIEFVMNKIGYEGRDCILRALCESSQVFGKKGSNMVSEIIRIAFSFPKSKVMSSEHKEISIYDDAHRKGRIYANCAKKFPKCGFSLLQLAMGQYSEPQRNYL